MRVATRRLRAVMRAARPMFAPRPIKALREELAWLGATLGGRRDLDVMREHLRGELGKLDAPGSWGRPGAPQAARARRARAPARSSWPALDSPRYLTAPRPRSRRRSRSRRWWTRTCHSPTWPPARGRSCERPSRRCRRRRPTRISMWCGSRPSGRAMPAELAAPAAGHPAERFVDRVKKLQDVLGRAPGRGGGRGAPARSWPGNRWARGPASSPASSSSASMRGGRPRARPSRSAGREVQRRGRKAWR